MKSERYLQEIFCQCCGRGILVEPKTLLMLTKNDIKKIECSRCIKNEKKLDFDFAVRVR